IVLEFPLCGEFAGRLCVPIPIYVLGRLHSVPLAPRIVMTFETRSPRDVPTTFLAAANQRNHRLNGHRESSLAMFPLLGTPREELDTPALCLDLDALEANIADAVALCGKAGIAWRPHAKCHKSPDI